MTTTQCARFPNLFSHRRDARENVTNSLSFALDASEEALYQAWAAILRAYCGEDGGVSFHCKHGIVTVEPAESALQYRPFDESRDSLSQSHTGVFVDSEVGSQALGLQLNYNVKEKTGEIVSCSHVPEPHLVQLEAELHKALSAISGETSLLNHSRKQGERPFIGLSVLNEKPLKLPGPDLLHKLISNPDFSNRIAIEYEVNEDVIESLSYSEVENQCAILAARICASLRLSNHSTQPIIPILLPQSPQLYIAMIAISRTGCAFCPLPLDAPPDRLRFILQDLSASVVVTDSVYEDRLRVSPNIFTIMLDDESSEERKEPAEMPTSIAFNASSTDVAYVMYTSGSTGQPKGVPVSNLAVTQSLLAHDRHIPAFDRFLQFASPTFDVSMFEIFFTFYRGSTLICCERSHLLGDLPSAMHRLKVDACELTPTVAAGLLQRRSNVPSLKLLLTIGEMLTPAVVQEFGGDESKESILWGMYGPTEAAIHCTLQPAFSSNSIVGNIGVPLDTVSAYILAPHQVSDRKGHVDVLPLGHIGELAVGGLQLANGYLNRLEQTSEAFIETEQHDRLYRTGDRARMLPDGSIECLGRISSGQVKLRGQRIELGEIQHAATRAKGCFDAVASIVRGNLVVFCLGDNGVTADAVLATCREWLPAFMVPGDAVVLTDYPRLSSGKVDRKQLERDYDTQKSGNDGEVAYASSSELNQIRNILEQVLGHPVNGKFSLTQMGLDSLSAIKAASALRRKGIEMTPFQLLDATNLQQLASRRIPSGAPQATSTATERVSVEGQSVALIPEILHPMRSEIEDVIICTPLQTSMLAETMKDTRAYCNWVELQLGPEWSVSKITEWLEILAGNNAILRSGFCQFDSIKHPFGLIRWKTLLKDQIMEVKELTRSFSLQDDKDYLRPVQFQIRKELSFTTLLVRLHHSLYDGWTLDLLLNDLDDLILEKPLRQRPQFDLVAGYYRSVDTSSSRQYWQDHLHEYQPISMPNYNGHIVTNPITQCHRFHFTSSLRKLRAWARNLGVGSQTTFQAALTYILSGYLGTSDVVIGTVTSGRTIPVDGIEYIMGPCLSTLPLRVNVAHSKRLSDLVKDINLCNRRMLEHGTETLQSIKHGCGVKTTESLWDVLFIWQETLETRTAQSRCVKMVDSFDRLECPMTLEVEPRGDEIIGKATYHSSVFPKEQVVLFFKQMDALVEHFISSTDLLLDNIGSCFPTSVRSVANPSPEAPKFDHGLTAMVECHARSRPNDTALIFTKTVDDLSKPFETLTYQQLNERANRLGRFLTEKVNVASELICICMEKSLDLYVAILAVLKTGRGYLPITPSTPRERIQTIVNEASTVVCLSHSQTSTSLGLYEFCSVINLDTADTSSTAEHDLNIAYKGSNIAYAVFTSGSTGTPKGVLVTQQNLLSNLESLSHIYPISAGGRLLQACSQAFDVSVFEVFFAWYTGMCLCSATNDVLFSDIEQCIRRLGITHLSLTPTVAALVCPHNVPKVKFLVTAGEAVTEKVMKTWADKGLYQGYGPSETTNICTVKPNVSTLDLINNIGRPLLNTSAFVMNPNGNEILPSGFVGELCFGGDQVFRGYLDQPKLSLEKIIDHPEYGRLYRSGDTGRLLPGGDILFSGRTDDQVKIRGQRVELGEINRRILSRSDIYDCTTFVMGDRQSRIERLVTFWVPQGLQSSAFSALDVSETTPVSAIIRSIFLDLSSVLPHYMMPTTLVPITSIPTTVQGKIDKKALTSCYHSLENDKLDACGIAIGGLEDVGAWSKVEVLVAQALSRVLNIHIRDVERHSSFFRLGLDSISAIRFAKLLRDTLNHAVSVSTILQNPSAARLAVQLEHTETPVLLNVNAPEKIFMNDVKSSIEAQARKAGLAISEIRPCTPLQEAMLSLGISSNISSSYCNTMLFQIKINVEVLERCWNAMTFRHEILRTYFVSTDDSAYPFAQVVLSQHSPKWISKQGHHTSNLVENANEIALSELPAAVDSLQPPYFLNILRMTSGCYLQFSCHHALHDGTALHILLGEVEKAVRGEELPDPVSFEPFLQEMVRHRSSEAMSFWQERLKDFRPTLLQSNDRVSAVHSQELDISLSTFEQSCQELGASVLSASQSAWAKTMQSLVGDIDVCFGNVVSGRTLSIDGLDKLVAPTFNTVPVRANMSKTKTNLELLRTLQKNNADLLPYQLTPLRSIQSKLGFGGSGIFSTMLLFQQEKFELDSSIWALAEEFGEMNFPVILELVPNRFCDTLLLNLYYDESIMSRNRAHETVLVFIRALKSCLQHPASRPNDYVGFSKETFDEIQPRTHRPQPAKLNISGARSDSFTAHERDVIEMLSKITSFRSSHFSPKNTIHQLGIDSIGAIQLAAKLRHRCGFDITAADILEMPRISDIALLIERGGSAKANLNSFDFQDFEKQHKSSICRELSLSMDDIDSVLPCTPLQMGIVSQFIRSQSMYANYITYEMDSTWSAESLEAAWKEVRKAHIMLRTGFVSLQEPHVSFAMVSYSADKCVMPIQLLQQSHLSGFDIGQWRQKSTANFHEKLSQPPWAVLIVDDGSRLHMHIAMLHALYDAHSLNIVLEDLATARTPNEHFTPTPIHPTLGYILNSSVVPSQSENGMEERMRFWKETFSNTSINRFPNLHPLQTSTGTTEVQSMKGSKTLEELERLCQKAGISLQAAGQAAWAQLLSGLIGERNITFGVVLSGRDTVAGSERAMFPCLTTVPVVVDVPQQNQDLLDSMMKVNRGIRRHQFTPTRDIQRWAERPGEALFDTIFALQKFSGQTQRKSWKIIDEVASSEYAISLELEPESKDLIMRATFLSDVIPKEQARILLDQFDALLVHLVTLPNANCYDGITDNANIFSITAAKQPTLPSPVQLLHQFVESQARASPERIAFEFAHEIVGNTARIQCWTYEKLNEEGNRISSLLLHHGAVPGDRIAICFEKCPEASFGILGILKAGCAYVALDPGAPPARKSFIVEDSDARLLLTSDRTANRFADSKIQIPILYIDEYKNNNDFNSSPILPLGFSPQSVCYCLYTSGTTGTPKGCEITHENAVQAMRAFSKLFTGRWDAHSKWLQFASFHFDVSVLEQFWTWSEGLCVVSAPRDLIFEDIARTIRVLGITHIDLTPSLASLLHPDEVPGLCRGVFITGGEQLKQEILDIWGSKECIHNGYGPTEATIGVTMYTRVPKNGKPANIGPQFDNVGSYVLHPGTETPVLRGGIGELCVAGKLVGKGYLNRPDLTREKFPIVDSFQERIYRTGDLVRILHDGSFVFLGRADDQVKLRGQRLELSEIDQTVKRGVRNIKDVATFVLKHPSQQKEQLVTFFVIAGSPQREDAVAILQNSATATAVERAREVCRAHLPSYMIPTHFISLNKLPLSSNNKTEAKIIKMLFQDLSINTLQFISASSERGGELSEKEAKVAGVLRKFVKPTQTELISSSSIFELGLDSISVIGFTRALKNAGFRNAQSSKVMRFATIKAIASNLMSEVNNSREREAILATQQMVAACSHRQRPWGAKVLKVTHSDIESIAPCTPLQQGIISRTLESDEPVYFSSFRYRLATSTQLNRLKAAWITTLERLQILRTRFIQTDDGHIQVVLRTAELPWFHVSGTKDQDVGALLDQRLKTLRCRNNANILHPFDITIVDSPFQSVLALSIFHGLYDGNSMPLLLSVVQKQYEGDKNIDYGPPFHAVLPHGPLHRARGAKAFWTHQIVERFESNIYSRNGEPSKEAPQKFFSLIQDLHALEKRCKELNVTHQAVVQACWAIVLRQHYCHPAVSLGVVVSGRSIDFKDAEKVIGPMFNTIPFQIVLNDSDTWHSIAKKCHEFNVAALPYQHTPLRDIRKWCKLRASNHLFQNLFIFQKETKELLSASKNKIWTALEDESFSDFPLAFEAELKIDNTIQISLVAQCHIADQTTLEKLATMFEHTIKALMEHPEGRINETIENVNGNPGKPSADEPRRAHDSPVNGANVFQWTKESLILRQEIAKLAAVDELTVAPDTSVFELGLDSIDAIKLSSRLIKHNIQIPVSSIMRKPSIATMVESLSATQHVTSAQHSSMLDKYESKLIYHLGKDNFITPDTERVLPATPLQESMVAEMLNSRFRRYYNHDVLKLSPMTEVDRLKTAWQLVYEASPVLRTCFKPISDLALEFSFAQVILQPKHLDWVDVEHSSEAEVHASLEGISRVMSTSSPACTYFRLTFATTPFDRFLILSIPHALYDGYSIDLLHNDVLNAYQSKTVPSRPSMRPVLEDIFQASTHEAQSFWSNYLNGAKSCLVSESLSGHQAHVSVHRQEQISRMSVENYRKFCKKQGITLQALGQACWTLVLASYVQKLEVVFGVVLSGRDTEEAQQVMFPTMNTIAFRAYLHGTGSELLRYTHENMSNIRQFQHFPLRRAQRFANTEGEKLFDTLFIYQTRPVNNGQEDSQLYQSVGGFSEVEFPVCVEMEVLEQELIWRIACSSDVFDADDTQKLIQSMERIAYNLVNNPETEVISFHGEQVSIGKLPAFTVAEEATGNNTTSRGQNDGQDEHELSQTEKALRKLLSTMSKVPENDIHGQSTLFHLGLDSITAIKISALLRKQNINISVSNMLRASTLEGIARFVDQSQSMEPASTTEAKLLSVSPIVFDTARLLQESGLKFCGLRESDIDIVVPASAGQVFMLNHWQNSDGELFFPEFPVLRSQHVNATDIVQVWNIFVRSHPILRSIFTPTGQKDSPHAQVFLKPNDEILSHEIQDGFPEGDISLSALGVVHKSETSLGLRQPLAFLSIHKLINGEWQFGLKIHHALYDGVSIALLVSELQSLIKSQSPTITSISNDSWKDFTSEAYNSRQSDTTKEFWTSYLGGVTTLEHTQMAGYGDQRQRFARYKPKFIEDARPLLHFAQKHGLSLPTIFLGVYAGLYHSIQATNVNSKDVIIGIYIANRSSLITGLETLPTVNLLPLRIDTSLSILDSARRIQEDLARISDAQNVSTGLWQIYEWTGVKVGTFVNWLRLPEPLTEEENEAAPGIEDGTKSKAEEERDEIIDGGNRKFVIPNELQGHDGAREAYVPNIDVEVALRNGGIDIGIFGPTALMNKEKVELMLSSLRNDLIQIADT